MGLHLWMAATSKQYTPCHLESIQGGVCRIAQPSKMGTTFLGLKNTYKAVQPCGRGRVSTLYFSVGQGLSLGDLGCSFHCSGVSLLVGSASCCGMHQMPMLTFPSNCSVLQIVVYWSNLQQPSRMQTLTMSSFLN